jgi:hypothetical protein
VAELDLNTVAEGLAAAGYDVIDATDGITAWRDADDGRAWEVVVDRGGQLKVTITYHTRWPTAKSVEVLGRRLSMLTERTATITAMFALEDSGELIEVLKTVEEAIRSRR